MFDAHSVVLPATPIQFAAAVEPCEALFIESRRCQATSRFFQAAKEQISTPGHRQKGPTIWA
jgi:hypothetical protein